LPTNLYGRGDNFDPETSRVVPALLRRIDAAMTSGAGAVKVWGTGRPRREFLHVDDFSDACLFLMKSYSGAMPINVGWGNDVSIEELASTIARIVGFEGRLEFDTTRPDGAPQKLLDVSRLNALGWHADTDLETGLRSTWKWYRGHLCGCEAVTTLRGAA
jgi:GDP-L-fucose synthase